MKKIENSTILTISTCVIASIAIVWIILITSCEVAIYADMDFYQREYEKYGVSENLNMEMEDIMYVTEEMMLYLHSNREDLIVDTIVAGESREFFNESEISHMEDVREIFAAGTSSRLGAILIMIIFLLVASRNKNKWKGMLAKSFLATTLVLGTVVGFIGALFATNFTKYFTIFHEIFFEGDTWIFDLNTSLMINMLPEGLFYDFTARIVMVFMGMMLVALATCVMLLTKNMKNKTKTVEK
ncbi:MAG: TIGR01906 family membrane protein [Eubacteriales bacterium]